METLYLYVLLFLSIFGAASLCYYVWFWLTERGKKLIVIPVKADLDNVLAIADKLCESRRFDYVVLSCEDEKKLEKIRSLYTGQCGRIKLLPPLEVAELVKKIYGVDGG